MKNHLILFARFCAGCALLGGVFAVWLIGVALILGLVFGVGYSVGEFIRALSDGPQYLGAVSGLVTTGSFVGVLGVHR